MALFCYLSVGSERGRGTMRKQVYAVRLSEQQRRALEAAAAGKQVRPRTLAQMFIDSALQREGYLPKTRQAQAEQA